MFLILLLAVGSIIAAFGYSTIAVATHKILSSQPAKSVLCFDCKNGTRRGHACYHYEKLERGDLLGVQWSRSISAFWIFVIPAYYGGISIAKAAVFAAKGPTKWGTYLAEFPRRHEIRQEKRAESTKALHKRIEELQNELDISTEIV